MGLNWQWYHLPHTHTQNCDMMVEAIKETGQIKRGQKDLEEQVSGSPVLCSHDNKRKGVSLVVAAATEDHDPVC